MFQIPVVCQNLGRVTGPFEVMPPDLESGFDVQEFPFPDGVVAFWGYELLGVESAGLKWL